MVMFFFIISGLSYVLIILTRHTESWGWTAPAFANSWEQVATWATYVLVFSLVVAISFFCFGSRKTSSK